jgi:hypothetical protein
MAEATRQRNGSLRSGLDGLLYEQAGYVRYRRAQWEATRGRQRRASSPGPLRFDESGFPIAQRAPGFTERVAQLLRPL